MSTFVIVVSVLCALDAAGRLIRIWQEDYITQTPANCAMNAVLNAVIAAVGLLLWWGA